MPASNQLPSQEEHATQDVPPALDVIEDSQAQGPTAPQTLAILRVLWGVLLLGQLLMIGIAAIVMRDSQSQQLAPDLVNKLFGFNAGLLVFNIILGTYLRSQIYKRCWRGNVISPLGYFTANVIMLALLEMVVFLGILVSILAKSFMPSLLPAILGMMVFAVNYPHGGPMFGNRDPSSLNFIKPTPEVITHETQATQADQTPADPNA